MLHLIFPYKANFSYKLNTHFPLNVCVNTIALILFVSFFSFFFFILYSSYQHMNTITHLITDMKILVRANCTESELQRDL